MKRVMPNLLKTNGVKAQALTAPLSPGLQAAAIVVVPAADQLLINGGMTATSSGGQVSLPPTPPFLQLSFSQIN